MDPVPEFNLSYASCLLPYEAQGEMTQLRADTYSSCNEYDKSNKD